ncbi:MAG TPA: hypothetical protein VMA72_23790 [Streptosporangiaceae bacterium]|nr:hypothetical protein [Streptosporangiaceae bacterium]
MRRFCLSGAFIAAIALFIGTVGLPAVTASADTGYINVEQYSAGSPASNVGLLSFSLVSDMPITSMTVDIIPEAGGAPALSLPLSSFTAPANDGNGSWGVWTVTSAITTMQLPLGSYSVEVTAASADASVSEAFAGILTFLNEISFPTFTSNGTTFSYDNQDVTFSGTAMILAPGGSPAPFSNASLVMTDNNSDTFPLTTAGDGSFSLTVPAKSEDFWAEYQGDSTTAFASTNPIAISVVAFPVSMTAKLSVPHAKYGQADKVTGTLTYSDNDVTKAFTGTTVSLYAGTYYPGETATATSVTNAGGAFSMPVPTTADVYAWTVESQGSLYFASASVGLTMTVAQPNYIQQFHASLNAFAIVSVRACVGASTGVFRVEYAAKAAGPWHSLGHLTNEGLSCTHGSGYGYGYSGKFGAHLASAYYRISYAANYQFQGAVTKPVHLARLLTKITSFRVSPRRLAVGAHFTVSGKLWAKGKNGKWSAYRHRRVIVILRYQGTWYRYRHSPTTNSAGRFSGRFPMCCTTPIFAQYNGDATHFASASKRIRVTKSGSSSGARPAAGQRLAAEMGLLAVRPALLWALR